MKTKYLTGITSVLAAMMLVLALSSCSSSRKMVQLSGDEISEMINNRTFTFVADRMNPLRGSQKNLTAYYDLTVDKDTLDSFLPYYGRARGIILPSDSGLRFTSRDFNYSVKEGKNNSWIVSIRPKDTQQVQSMTLTIFENGSSTLDVNSTNKDPISFYGNLQPVG